MEGGPQTWMSKDFPDLEAKSTEVCESSLERKQPLVADTSVDGRMFQGVNAHHAF